MELGLCIEMAFAKEPFPERMRKAAKAGFRNVEMWFVDRSWTGGPEELARLAKKSGVRITTTVIGSPDGSIGGGLTNPANREQWLERARMTMEFNRRAGIAATIVCTGNRVPELTEKQMRDSVVEGLKETTRLAERNGITLFLEPLNTPYDHPGYWLCGSDAGAELCREVGSERLRLLFDCYHMQIMEGDLLMHIGRHLDVIGHFHCAGVPGRHEPETGEVNYRFLVGEIEKLGYTGVFGLEYAPSMEHELSVRRTLRYIKGR